MLVKNVVSSSRKDITLGLSALTVIRKIKDMTRRDMDIMNDWQTKRN
jgi:hypothetical protein|tara:strand:+ start:291 stop:431 length:141 start_codon:yes stop_codon:yes gene_type:complete